MPFQYSTSYLEEATALFAQYKSMADTAIAQVSDEQLLFTLDPESNSITLIVKRMAGNMRSRWTDFLTTDGEKLSRDRDSEFDAPLATRAELLALWEAGWQILFSTLASLGEQHLTQTVSIRGEVHSVMQAINRQVAHYSYYTGQIVFLSKHLATSRWRTLSVARNGSVNFNQAVASGEKSQR